MTQSLQHIPHITCLIEDHDDTRAERQTRCTQIFKSHLYIQMLRSCKRARRTTKEDGLQLLFIGNSTRHVEQFSQSYAERDFVQSWLQNIPGNAEKFWTRRFFRANLAVFSRTLGNDQRNVTNGFHIVDHCWLAKQTLSRGEGRLHTRETTLSLDRLKQRGLLATNVGASADAKFNIKGKAGAKNIVTQQVCCSGFVQCVFKNRQNIGVFCTDINVSLPRPDRIGGNGKPLNCTMRIIQQEDAVLKCTRLRLVRVADHILFSSRCFCRAFPFDSRWECRAAAPNQSAGFNLVHNFFWLHRHCFGKSRILSVLCERGGSISAVGC